MQTLDYFTILLTFAGLAFFASKRLRQSLQWRATITPLASIIGSGFLIVAPLLHALIGRWALAGMCLLLLLAYAIGAVIRFNIRYAEPHLEKYPGDAISKLETVAQLFLGLAFAISVAFYTSLLVAFVFDTLTFSNPLYINLSTSVLLLAIMSVAWWRGAHGLESVELVAVTIKLAIIMATIIALASYDVISAGPWFQHKAVLSLNLWDSLAMLAGMLMVTQGFETARYLGDEYSPVTRVKALKYSQWLSTLIYLLFIVVTNPVFLQFPVTELSETTIIHVLGQALIVLPVLLLVAAIASQLSAALADTIGGGGLLKELIPLKLSDNFFYMLVIAIAILLIWTSHVFEIINYASKGFAIYYLIQVFISISLLIKGKGISLRTPRLFGCYCLVLILAFVIFGSTPAPHH